MPLASTATAVAPSCLDSTSREFQEFRARCVRSPWHPECVAKLTSEELQAARRRSGRLGGRPPKPTVGEARAEALERLVPKAIQVLEEHLGSGRPDAWRSAHRILEHSWGRPPEYVAPTAANEGEIDGTKLSEMSTEELLAIVSRARAARDLTHEREEPAASNDAATALASG